MRIYEDSNGLRANAISTTAQGADVSGHLYQVLLPHKAVELEFQLGSPKFNGVNGLTNEALLAVLIHRMGVLNKAFPCRQNALAITKLEEAAHWLEDRTRERTARGVEGQAAL